METQRQENQEPPSIPNPVGFEKHYTIFKAAESSIMEQLGKCEHDEFQIGLRVAYDVLNSPNEPDVMPYAVDAGYLGPVDRQLKCGLESPAEGEEVWQMTTSSGVSVHPLPRDFMEALYNNTKAALEAEASQELKVGVFAVLYGSPVRVYFVSCACPGLKRKYCCYNPVTKTNTYYCSQTKC
jgi:hypothetical protein